VRRVVRRSDAPDRARLQLVDALVDAVQRQLVGRAEVLRRPSCRDLAQQRLVDADGRFAYCTPNGPRAIGIGAMPSLPTPIVWILMSNAAAARAAVSGSISPRLFSPSVSST
jgi:hypothetical protein